MRLYDDKMLTEVDWLAEENDLTLRVKQLTWENDRVLSVTLTSADGFLLPPWEPGAHIDVHLSSSLVRQYSLCGDPDDLSHYRIGVLREDVSLGGSSFVHGRLRPGEKLSVTGPRNRFRLVPASKYLFVAGGIGITPLLAMIRTCQAREADWRLVYAGHRRAGMAFISELASYGDRVEIHPADEGGRVDLEKLIASVGPDTEVYACGPEEMLGAIEESCTTHNPQMLHLERFKAKTRPDTTGSDASIEVVCQRSGLTLSVPPTSSILEEMERAGLDTPSSCREGICGTCETPVLEGVPDHRDSLLTPDEQEAGDIMMVCVSRARSERLVLDA